MKNYYLIASSPTARKIVLTNYCSCLFGVINLIEKEKVCNVELWKANDVHSIWTITKRHYTIVKIT